MAGCFAFHDVDDVLDPDEAAGADGDGDVRALVVGAPLGYFPGAGAETGDGHDDLDGQLGCAVFEFAEKSDLIVHEAVDFGHRRRFVDEIGKCHFNVAGVGFETLSHFAQHGIEGFNGNLAFVMVENFHEAGHMSALEVVGQIDIHVKRGDGVLLALAAVLDAHRMANVFNAHFVYGNAAGVGAALYVGNRMGGVH